MDAHDIAEKEQDWEREDDESGIKLRERANEWSRKAKHQARRAAQVTNDYVRDKPWESVGYVAAAAFIAGFLLGKIRRLED